MAGNIYNDYPPHRLGIIQSRAARNLTEFRENLLHDFGLGSPEWFILGYVAEKTEQGGVKVGTIASTLDVHSTYVTGILRRLEAKDLVSSRPGRPDRRVRMVTATKKGLALSHDIETEYIKQNDKWLPKASSNVLRHYITVLERLAEQRLQV